MSGEYAKCLKRERDREACRRETEQGAFEAEMLSFDRLVDSFEDPSKAAIFSDCGAGAAAIRSADEVGGSSFYTRRIKVARVRLSRNHPELLEVFNLIVKNGKNRRESIAKLAANGRTEEAANALYWKHLKKISFFFKVPY